MDEQAYYERLDSNADDPADLFEHVTTRTVDGRTHHLLPDSHHGVERGTVVVEGEGIVRGYPSTPRILVLETGVESVFEPEETVVIEEKLNGFNVRLADVDGRYAFTRSGYVCPYTTARAEEILDLDSFFEDHPDKMLCGELIGPETPYTVHDYEGIETNDIRIFSIRDRESGDPVPIDRRRDLCEAYGFEQPREFGRCPPDEAVDTAREAVDELDAAGREGIVLKTLEGELVSKYATESQIHNDLEYAFSIPFEAGRDFIFSRVIRDAFQAVEFDDSEQQLRARAHELGESILLPMVETIRDVREENPVGQRHTVRGDPDAVGDLLEYLRSQGLRIELLDDRTEGDVRILEFVKIDRSSRDTIEYYLDGGTRDE